MLKLRKVRPSIVLILVGLVFLACADKKGAPVLSKERPSPDRLRAGQAAPPRAEVAVVGAIRAPILRNHPRFSRLVASHHPDIVFKDEERSGADRMMSKRLRTRLHRLAERVQKEWPNLRLRVTEAWDEQSEHGARSLHYEGRAADLTTSDRDTGKLGRLAGLAVAAGFDWVYFENVSHVHVSVR